MTEKDKKETKEVDGNAVLDQTCFKCLVEKSGTVHWKAKHNPHNKLFKEKGFADDTADLDKIKYARAWIYWSEYKKQWKFRIMDEIKPTWFDDSHIQAVWDELPKWMAASDINIEDKPIGD